MPDEAEKLAPPSTARRMAAGGVNINRLLDLRPWQSGPWDMEYGEAPTDLPEFRPAEWRHARALRDRFWEALRGRQLGCSQLVVTRSHSDTFAFPRSSHVGLVELRNNRVVARDASPLDLLDNRQHIGCKLPRIRLYSGRATLRRGPDQHGCVSGLLKQPALTGLFVHLNKWVIFAAALLVLLVLARYMQHREQPAICADHPTAPECHR